MDPRSLLRSLPELVRPLLPHDLRDFRSGARWVLVQLWYGNRDLHYEAWHRGKLQTIEIGLHFEADELTNARLIGAFRGHEHAIAKALPAARIEEWDKGWARIWEPVTYEALDERLQRDLAERLARHVTTLEPILRDVLPADVPWQLRGRPARTRGRQRTRARADRASASTATRTRPSGRPRR